MGPTADTDTYVLCYICYLVKKIPACQAEFIVQNVETFSLHSVITCMCVFSANAQGLRQPIRRLDLWEKFKELKGNIILLQETHLVNKDLNTLKKEWNVDFFISGGEQKQ